MTGEPRWARSPLRQVPRDRWLAADLAGGAGLAAALAISAPPTGVPVLSAPLPAGYALAAAAGFAVASRRVWLWPALLLATGASLAAFLFGFSKDPFLAIALVLYLVAVRERPRASLAALLAVEALVIATLAVAPNSRSQAIFSALVARASVQVAAWALGYAVRRQRADARGRILAQREFTWRAVTQERLRIARDLHDVVAHSMSLIAVQAGVGHHLIDTQPDQARSALGVIETTSRDTLHEMRQLLAVLRDSTSDGDTASSPTPTLADLGTLITGTQPAGLEVDLRVLGERRALPAGIELAAYRIVQEALTNVVKHAHTKQCRVVIDYRTGELAIEISDNGTGASPTRNDGHRGHGIIGMRERAAACNGHLTAGPLPTGGYRVAALLPDPGPVP